MRPASPPCRISLTRGRPVIALARFASGTWPSRIVWFLLFRAVGRRFARALATRLRGAAPRRGSRELRARLSVPRSAALLLACAVLGSHGAASAQSSKEIDVWSGTVTVDRCGSFVGYWRNVDDRRCPRGGSLSDTSFTLDGADHTITLVGPLADSTTVPYRTWFNFYFSEELRVDGGFNLYLDGTIASRGVCAPQYWFGSSYSDQLCWPSAVLDARWTDGSRVEVKVTELVSGPPAPPVVTATAIGPTRVDLSWSAPAFDLSWARQAYVDEAGITGYRIEFSADGGATYELITTTGPTATSYSHTAAPSGTTLHYRVSTVSRLVEKHQLTPGGRTDTATTAARGNAAPVFDEGESATRTLAENAAAGEDVGAPLTATDSDGDTLTYTLAGADADSFDIDPATGQVRTRQGVTYDFETKPAYFVVVGASDGQGGSANILVTVNLVDVDEEPTGLPQPGKHRHRIPLVLSADSVQQSFLRIINDSDEDGTVRIHAVDDEGRRFGPIVLALDALETQHFNSGDLERGARGKGLSGGIGEGRGHWRLELDTDLDIQPLAYIRSPAGFVTSMHDVAEGASMRWRVYFFNPASNIGKQSRLRVINVSGIDTDVVIEGRDDRGDPAPGGKVRFTLPADAARMLTVQELERGYSPATSDFEFEGRLGDGQNKWQLFVSAGRPIQVMSLMRSGFGLLSNLSSAPGDDVIRGTAGADELRGGNGDDVIDPGDNGHSPGELDIVHGSAGDDRIRYTGSSPNAIQSVRYAELGAGVTVTIDGAANRATVDKGSAGTDTIVDVANPLNAGGSPPYDGVFELHGTPSDDTFNLALDDGQWMDIVGNAGADTFNIESGDVRIDYETSPAGVDVDLDAGGAEDDGFGASDTFNGTVWGVAGSDFSDVIRGSDNDEAFFGRAGRDDIDGGGGFDTLRFGSSNSRFAGLNDTRDLEVDLGAGTATGTWNGKAFSYTLRNIERVRGGTGDDIIRGSDYGDVLDGGAGDDHLNPGDADGSADEYDEIEGSTGNDRIIFTEQSPPIWTGLGYNALGSGITATIDGVANTATIDKGSTGTDTVVDVVNPMNSWALGLTGTRFDDVFNVTVGAGQILQLRGGAGSDTFNIQSAGTVRLQFHHAPAGIDLDLGAGRVNDDGHGDADIVSGAVGQVRCSEFSDIVRGSDNDEWFECLAGDDVIDGGGGFDTLGFHRRGGARNLIVFTGDEGEDGIATGTWNGK